MLVDVAPAALLREMASVMTQTTIVPANTMEEIAVVKRVSNSINTAKYALAKILALLERTVKEHVQLDDCCFWQSFCHGQMSSVEERGIGMCHVTNTEWYTGKKSAYLRSSRAARIGLAGTTMRSRRQQSSSAC